MNNTKVIIPAKDKDTWNKTMEELDDKEFVEELIKGVENLRDEHIPKDKQSIFSALWGIATRTELYRRLCIPWDKELEASKGVEQFFVYYNDCSIECVGVTKKEAFNNALFFARQYLDDLKDEDILEISTSYRDGCEKIIPHIKGVKALVKEVAKDFVGESDESD